MASELESRRLDEQHHGESSKLSEMIPSAGTPERAKPRLVSETPHTKARVEAPKRRAKITKRNAWLSMSRQMLSDSSESGYHVYSLVVKLRFSGRLIIEEISDCSATPRSSKCEVSTDTAKTSRQSLSFSTPNAARTARMLPLFDRPWIDETQDFNMRIVRSTLRNTAYPVADLGANYIWYTDAVPIDALLPPGVPVSAKEILAFYPHHIRWRDVMLRLARNNYRGGDIFGMQAFFRGRPSDAISAATINTYLRDGLRAIWPGFKTETFSTKHDRNLYTLHLSPGKYILDKRNGFTVPTLGDLTCGLRRLPAGLDARCLTECLEWYLSWRGTFTPPLDLNVLHVQALSRALRIPLKPFGPQNLDLNALEEWKTKGGRFEERSVPQCAPVKPSVAGLKNDQHAGTRKNRININLDSEGVTIDLQLPIRHVLTFPFVALHGVVAEAVKLGIAKAEIRRMKRENSEKELCGHE